MRLPTKIAEPLRITAYSYNGDGVICAPFGPTTLEVLCRKQVQATTDADGSMVWSATPDGPARVWSYTYNGDGQVLTIDGPRAETPNDITTFTYYLADDPVGNYKKGDLASTTNAKGHVTSFTHYDGVGRLARSVDPNGLETLLDYYPRGWLKTKRIGTTAVGYETTTYEYDSLGQLKKVTLPDLSFTSYDYDAAHRLTDVRDGLNNHIHYTLDPMGNRIVEQAYDSANTLVRVHSRTPDALNRVWKDIGGTIPATQVTVSLYDDNGNLKTVEDPLHRVTTQFYDQRNRLKETQSLFNGAIASTKYGYNGLDGMTSVTDPNNLVTTYVLNGHGEVVSQTSPDTGLTTFPIYDAASNLKKKTDPRPQDTLYVYDELNRVQTITYSDELVTYTYDSCVNGIGHLCQVSDRSGSTSYSYDVKGRVTSKTQNVNVASGTSRPYTMAYSYNPAGQLERVTTPGGRQISYGFQNNRPVSISVNGASVLSGTFYEPFGPNGGWVWGNSSQSAVNTHARVYDLDFRAKSVSSDLPSVAPSVGAFSRRFLWDEASRLRQVTDDANSLLTSVHDYDDLDHLKLFQANGASKTYSYDAIGNRQTDSAGGYTYFAGTNRVQSGPGAQSFTYDPAGNQLVKGSTSRAYTGNNRAYQAVDSSLPVAAVYTVNALGQRVMKENSAGEKTIFVYDESGRLSGEYDSNGTPLTETVWLEELPVAVLK